MQKNSSPAVSRRRLFAGAATAGAAAAAVSVLPSLPATEVAAEAPKPAPEKGGGYSLSDHVKHYYRTTRV